MSDLKKFQDDLIADTMDQATAFEKALAASLLSKGYSETQAEKVARSAVDRAYMHATSTR
jgi:hypothetical protein